MSIQEKSGAVQSLRIVGAIIFIAVAAVTAILFVVGIGVVSPQQIVGDWQFGQTFLRYANQADGGDRVFVTVTSFVMGVTSLYLVLRLAIGGERGSTHHILATDEHGFVVIDSRGIAVVAMQAAMGSHGVVETDVDVKGTGKGPVRLRVDVGVYPGANVKRAGNEAREAVREAVEELVGIGVRDVVVAVHVIEPDKLSRLLR